MLEKALSGSTRYRAWVGGLLLGGLRHHRERAPGRGPRRLPHVQEGEAGAEPPREVGGVLQGDARPLAQVHRAQDLEPAPHGTS